MTKRGASPANEASMGARIGGVMIAIITGALSVLLIATLFVSDVDGIDAVMRVGSAILLAAIAILVGMAAVTPGVLRSLIERVSGSG